MSNLKWRRISEEKPTDKQCCLTKCKYGIIQGRYNEKEQCFEGYYWNDLSWNADVWVPIEELKP